MEPDAMMPLNQSDASSAHQQHSPEEWAEVLARTVAHLAAQLTITQLRLRALASELNSQAIVDESAVADRLRVLARTETGTYLRENLGEALAEVVEVDALATEIASFLDA